jgi:hypothetical protein
VTQTNITQQNDGKKDAPFWQMCVSFNKNEPFTNHIVVGRNFAINGL